MDELNVIKSTAQIAKYCKEQVCEGCLFYDVDDNSKCMWRHINPCSFNFADMLIKWVDENE